jgi:adenylate cyclase
VRVALLLATGVVAAGAGLVAQATGALRRPEGGTVDARFAIRGRQEPPRGVAVVGIDDASIGRLGEWPIRRRYHALAIDRLRRAGAKVIAYDVQFTEPGPSEADDEALFTATRRAGNVVLATTEVDAQGRAAIFGDPANLRDARGTAGNANWAPDPGGVVRRYRDSVDKLDTLAVAAVKRGGTPVDRAGLAGDGAWIDYAGPPGTIPTYSFERLLPGRVPARDLRGRIVFVGLTTPSEQDVHPTSYGSELMPGAEIHASAAATILAGLPVDDAPWWLTALSIAVVGLAAPVAGLRLTGLRPLLAGAAVLVAYLVAVQLAFAAGTILPVLTPLLAFALAAFGTVAVYYLVELRDRRRLRADFARFVPAAVVDEVVDRAEDDLRLGGVRREGTVMFCDLRGFTGWAEGQPAERVIEVLNRYLTEMSDAILDRGGTVVSYMGDGIMAVFGAPIEQRDHADRALAAARAMLEGCLPRFNAWLGDDGSGEDFRMGIGLNSGPVMSGNVGSERRLEYTAVGDTTNTASRIEALTKGTDHQLLVAEATHRRLQDADGLVPAGEFAIRGREERVRLWSTPPTPGR